jgi:hypothetical protein
MSIWLLFRRCRTKLVGFWPCTASTRSTLTRRLRTLRFCHGPIPRYVLSYCVATQAPAASVLHFITCLLLPVGMSFQALGPISTQLETSMESWRSLACSISRSVTPTQSVFSAAEMQLCRTRAQAMDTGVKKAPLGHATRTLARTEASVASFSGISPAGVFQRMASKAQPVRILPRRRRRRRRRRHHHRRPRNSP